MSDNLQERIKTLIKLENEKRLSIAKLEQKIESLKEERTKLLNQLKEYNISEEDVDIKLNEMKEELEAALSYAEGILK